MLAEPTTSQALEKTVIAGFNTKLAAKITSFKANNTGVRLQHWHTSMNAVLLIRRIAGHDLAVGRERGLHDDPQRPDTVRIRRRSEFRKHRRLLGVSRIC